jgi:hypothetical protein
VSTSTAGGLGRATSVATRLPASGERAAWFRDSEGNLLGIGESF